MNTRNFPKKGARVLERLCTKGLHPVFEGAKGVKGARRV